jgi:hypothetical protein
MKKRTRQLHVVNPGILSGTSFVAWYEVEDSSQGADDYLFSSDEPDERPEFNKTDWKQAAAILPKAWHRLVRQLPWRKAA